MQNDSLKDNSSPPAASFDRAASSGNNTFTDLGVSASSVQLSQPSHSSPNSSIYRFGKWGDMEKAGRKRQKAPQKRSKEGHTDKWKGAEHIFQKAEIPTSIRTCCLSNMSFWQTQLTSSEKMSVLIKDGGKKTKSEIEESHQKNRSYAKTGGKGKGHLSSPSMEKWCHMTKNNSEGHLGIFAPYRPPGEMPIFPQKPFKPKKQWPQK